DFISIAANAMWVVTSHVQMEESVAIGGLEPFLGGSLRLAAGVEADATLEIAASCALQGAWDAFLQRYSPAIQSLGVTSTVIDPRAQYTGYTHFVPGGSQQVGEPPIL